ncbi:ABC-type transport auxiliary lipoprotein family protein [Marinobacter confluentis]|uniref:ABC-type transport auxiliary lipoprotein component domain-containing protein n=1 Tax=Marinobacter confluentis TaxID=1697557 RepID=A0A4Z1CC36_9GAMM|nr:ABC-type transport auxiliary lipoprotein family protein [Marinobacter confluentis]TGN41736.1 hypothetical protein E5Q11_04215 [Marinobacter confluentis]
MKNPITGLLIALFLITLVSGCTLLPERTARNAFMLPAPQVAKSRNPAVPVTLRVLTPQAESPLDGTYILVSPREHIIQAYAGARWSNPTPVMVRDHWIEGLRQNGGLKAVVSESSEASSQLTLSSDLGRFRMHYPQGQAMVEIQLDAQLLESQSRRVLAVKRFQIELAIDDQPVESVIAGFGEASQALTEDMVSWLLSTSEEIYKGADQ